MFEVGQQVVCINDAWRHLTGGSVPNPAPYLGQVVTISDAHQILGRCWLVIEGFGERYGWAADYFRPVRKTDISCFTKLLAPTPKVRA